MRILLVQNLVYVPSHGGANKANRLLLAGLAARGHDCRAVALATAAQGAGTRDVFLGELASRGLEVTASAPGVDVFRADGVEVHAVSEPARLLPTIAAQAAAFVPDCVVLSHAGPAQALLEAALEAAPGRLVYLAHTTLWLPFGPGSFRQDPAEAALLRRAAAVVAVSRFGRDYLKRWGDLDAEVLAFPMYGPRYDKLPFPDLARFDQGAVTLVNPSSVKGISIFLELAARFPGLPFAAVPTYRTTRADREALEALPNVQLWPATDDVDQLLAQVRVLLMPSLWDEAFGVMAVEAMLRGIPVLASDAGGLPEAKLGVDYVLPVRRIERYEARFDDRHEPIADLPPQDVGPWEAALREVTTDRAVFERVSRDSRAAALAWVGSLGWEPFEDLFRRVAGRAAGAVRASAAPERPLATLSPERRELVALLLLDRRQGLTEANSPLVAIDPEGPRRPLFLVHPAAGTVDCYVALARHLDPEQPLYAFQAAGVGGRGEPCDRVEAMAARYVAALRRRQPGGPYLLGGWSLGAIVAFEMARQLRKLGEEIDLLAVFDSHAPLAPGEDVDERDLDDDESLLARWARELGGGGEADAEVVLRRLKELRLLPAGAGPDDLRRGLRVYRAHRRAVLTYRVAETYPGRITLFRAAPSSEGDLGWGRVSEQPVEIHDVPGGHYEILSEPQVGALAECLRQALTPGPSPSRTPGPPGEGSETTSTP
jgi:thioesterase domain-containing protein/glycosyltransferase involved in cell wall biosynthesis